MFLIRDHDGHVHSKVKDPGVVIDKKTGTLIMIGEASKMEDYRLSLKNRYESFGAFALSKDLVTMKISKDQDEIDKVFQITGYVKTLYDNLIKTVEEEV
ncbi:hypothetical protein CIL05_07620 [Virgibacillus profundi]|uniref:Uncharacterized protein n=1 Tax=Virgibacillus profundi TaxID=2024555 RepID=A0A2A2IGR1_9BACI|nr:hypothetical protein [Virgibacillus profundi]PAV30330.1 hypothetical protein CIL05_07620 [Virgibacillus profundi]PXY54502.1 hypothetical protein CIT14_07705 [Virgibacillus profundi]